MEFPAAAATKTRAAVQLHDTWGGWEAEEEVGAYKGGRALATNTPHTHLTASLPSSSTSPCHNTRRELLHPKSTLRQLRTHTQSGPGDRVPDLCCCCCCCCCCCSHVHYHYFVICIVIYTAILSQTSPAPRPTPPSTLSPRPTRAAAAVGCR